MSKLTLKLNLNLNLNLDSFHVITGSGIDPDDVEIMMDKGILSIKGERKSEVQEHAERYSRIERRYGMFHRRFALPDSADPEGITAQGHNGVLEISIPKRPETTPRRIPVGKRETRVS